MLFVRKDEERPEAAAVDGVSEDMKSEGSEDMSEGSEDEEVVHAVITDHGSAIGLLTECNPAEVTEVTVVTPVRRGRGRPPKQKGHSLFLFSYLLHMLKGR